MKTQHNQKLINKIIKNTKQNEKISSLNNKCYLTVSVGQKQGAAGAAGVSGWRYLPRF